MYSNLFLAVTTLSMSLLYLVIIVLTIFLFLYLAKNTDKGKSEVPKTGGSTDNYPDLGNELYDREKRDTNPVMEDQTFNSSNVVSKWEIAHLHAKEPNESPNVPDTLRIPNEQSQRTISWTNKSSEGSGPTTVSKYSGPKYSRIKDKDIENYLFRISKNNPQAECIPIVEVLKGIAKEYRDDFVSPYSFYTEKNNNELANAIGISVSSLNKYFKNETSEKMTAEINAFFKENIKNYSL